MMKRIFGNKNEFDDNRPSYKKRFTSEERSRESRHMLDKFPDRVPVIVQRKNKSDVSDIDKEKYLVPVDLSIGKFVYVIRKRINLTHEKALYVFTNNTIPPTSATVGEIYLDQKDSDGFLYITYASEQTFG